MGAEEPGLARLLAALGAPRRRQVFTHSSWAPRREASYERLEFLGDSVLQVVVSEDLMRRHPGVDEGDLSWMRQSVVARDACARVAVAAGLPEALVAAAPAPRREAARSLAERASVRAALVEAVIGAAWLDLGPVATAPAVLEAFAPILDAAVPGARDPKTALQEEAARRRLEVSYELADTQGPPERRTFTSRVLVGGRAMGRGAGSSKQASEAAAAAEALDALRGEG
ncbi:MAG: ribonuclease III family protein [Thermoleophilia bacterium]